MFQIVPYVQDNNLNILLHVPIDTDYNIETGFWENSLLIFAPFHT